MVGCVAGTVEGYVEVAGCVLPGTVAGWVVVGGDAGLVVLPGAVEVVGI